MTNIHERMGEEISSTMSDIVQPEQEGECVLKSGSVSGGKQRGPTSEAALEKMRKTVLSLKTCAAPEQLRKRDRM